MAEFASQKPAGFKNHIENIAIVGAGGQSGKWITEALLQKGKQKITAITREGSTNQLPSGVIVKKVDYNNHSQLVESLKNQDALIITMSVTAPPGQQAKLIEAAAEAKVPWILPNEFGTDGSNEEAAKDVLLGPMKKKDRDLIEKLGMKWIGVACGFWYEFSLSGFETRYGFDFKKRSVLFYDDGETKINTTTFPQVGRAVANLVALPIQPPSPTSTTPTLSTYTNTYLRISSFEISQRDMFASVLRVTKTAESDWKISYVPVKQRFEEGKKMMQEGNMVGFGQLLYARAFYPDNAGNFGKTAIGGLDNERLGLPEEDLDEFTGRAVEMVEKGYHLEGGRAVMDPK